jgi:hypothetical protein
MARVLPVIAIQRVRRRRFVTNSEHDVNDVEFLRR